MKKKHDIRVDRSLLHPWLNYKMDLLLKKCEKQGIYLIITEGFRTKEYQDKLYAKGRTAPGKIVTNAKGSTYSSQHMWGIAFDIAINDKKHMWDESIIRKVAKIGKSKSVGLGWGGDWKSFPDTPHFYLKAWGSTTSKLKALYGTPKNFRKTWTGRVEREKGLLFWKTVAKTGYYCRIPDHTKVKILYTKSWYKKVTYKGHTGYLNKNYLD